jgi:hypothetical protein
MRLFPIFCERSHYNEEERQETLAIYPDVSYGNSYWEQFLQRKHAINPLIQEKSRADLA